MTMQVLTDMPEWAELRRHHDALKHQRLSDLVLGDPQRLDRFALSLDGIHIHYGLNRITPETMALLTKLAAARDVEGWRARMWRGEKINVSENRAALHVALRQSENTPIQVDGIDIVPDIRLTQRRMADFINDVRGGRYLGATGKPIRHVVNIGIGGSDLGPRMATLALTPYAASLQVHFVANADVFELLQVFKTCDPAETLFIVVSKTFTTQETMLNAATARTWVVQQLGEKAVARHFSGVSVNSAAATDFGLVSDHIFPLWDWVGGRFSLWSAVGLALGMAIGWENYRHMLRGAEAMDGHFKSAPLDRNMPVLLAMLGVWSRNFLGCAAHAILPYSERLRELPRYLQQLEMESNGKSVGRGGEALGVETAPVIFGEPGTVAQHSFHQWLHQSADIVSADFIGVSQDDFGHPEHHRALVSNMVAQAGVLAFGQNKPSSPYDVYSGNRGSTVIMLERLDPFHLGLLLALYEHKVFVQSVIWGLNPFDQPGVELGKRVARSLIASASASDPAGQVLTDFYRIIAR